MIEGILSFLLICIVIELTPGPNMAYLTMVSSLHGKKAGLSMVAGIATGLLIIGLVVAFGLSAFIIENPTFYHLLRWSGAFYLVWLAWENWHAAPISAEITSHFDRLSFWRGFVTNILNPKVMMFYVTVFPSFIDITRPIVEQTIIMIMVYVTIATIIHCLIAILGGQAGVLTQHPRVMQFSRYGFSIALLLVAFWFMVGTRSI